MSPTARTLAHYRSLGFLVEKVEQQIPGTFIKRDFLGCADLIACHPVQGIVALQVTSGTNHATRRRKASQEPRLEAWLRAGGRFQVVSWRLAGAKGKRKKYEIRVEELDLFSVLEAR